MRISDGSSDVCFSDLAMRVLIGQAARFTVVGVVLMAIDTGVFSLLHWLGLALLPANTSSRVVAALASFYLNGRFSFAGHGEPRPHAIRLGRYVIWWLLMTAISTGEIGRASCRERVCQYV